jgi:FtsP/CotA-like multicopper oxidase with cupredoxin domain
MDASATPPRVTSLAPVAGKNGGTVTYTFTPTKPGTYLYESGTNPAKQVEMGLYGALIVYPTSSSSGDPRAYDSADTQFQAGREFIHILSEVDPAAHLAVEQNKPFDWTTYAPKYFLLNGRSAPDTVAPNGAPWLPSQPYGAMVHVRPFVKDPADPGDHEPALVRYLNVSRTDVAFHPHGNTEHVVAEDASPLVGVGPGDHSYGSFLVDVGANRTVDALFTWEDVEGYSPANPLPIEVPGFQDLMIKGTWYSMSPYLGQTGVLPAGQASFNQCGEYYHMAHNHNLSKATNYGVSFGGQMTLIRIDPANGC